MSTMEEERYVLMPSPSSSSLRRKEKSHTNRKTRTTRRGYVPSTTSAAANCASPTTFDVIWACLLDDYDVDDSFYDIDEFDDSTMAYLDDNTVTTEYIMSKMMNKSNTSSNSKNHSKSRKKNSSSSNYHKNKGTRSMSMKKKRHIQAATQLLKSLSEDIDYNHQINEEEEESESGGEFQDKQIEEEDDDEQVEEEEEVDQTFPITDRYVDKREELEAGLEEPGWDSTDPTTIKPSRSKSFGGSVDQEEIRSSSSNGLLLGESKSFLDSLSEIYHGNASPVRKEKEQIKTSPTKQFKSKRATISDFSSSHSRIEEGQETWRGRSEMLGSTPVSSSSAKVPKPSSQHHRKQLQFSTPDDMRKRLAGLKAKKYETHHHSSAGEVTTSDSRNDLSSDGDRQYWPGIIGDDLQRSKLYDIRKKKIDRTKALHRIRTMRQSMSNNADTGTYW
mmetsp:Transcript_10656/g.25419  ORF Transcript_10656/g.25419 Transcript_10656/m.25419 type:complete len:446 (-) Transcript_10656:210-1547(-)